MFKYTRKEQIFLVPYPKYARLRVMGRRHIIMINFNLEDSSVVYSVLVLSLHSADDTEVEDEEMLEDDDEEEEEELEEDVDSDVFPSMMIITRFSAGVPSACKHLQPDQSGQH